MKFALNNLGATNTINNKFRRTKDNRNKTAALMLFTSVRCRLTKANPLFLAWESKSLNQLSNSHLKQNYFEVISIGDYRDKYQTICTNHKTQINIPVHNTTQHSIA
uniref:Uncharacterized protein n=1 Tax=Glossina pallidipes TaxID=7398 RepID=A0A1B0A318_GLOPL